MIRIFLTGYMGAGKTTLGKALARELHIPFIDLDWYIEERFHKTVGELFSERGEASFRELEKNMLHEVGEFEDVVISTGGGAPCFFDNMEYMNRVGTTVFLDVDPKVLFSRLRVAKQQRPILQGKKDDELLDFIVQALEKRAPFYRQANYIYCADKLEDSRFIHHNIPFGDYLTNSCAGTVKRSQIRIVVFVYRSGNGNYIKIVITDFLYIGSTLKTIGKGRLE